jgi:molybdopterin molybdotransferase
VILKKGLTMAQLKDDCFAFGGQLTSVAEALDDLQSRLSTVCDVEEVSIHDALGRIIAEDIFSPRDVPPHDNSAVDGYAVYFSDLNPDGDTELQVTGRIAAGHPLGRAAKTGEALRIFTGAPVPDGENDGPDTIFMEEDCSEVDGVVTLPAGLAQGSNKRDQGEDVKTGALIIATGSRLRPQEIGLAASVGRAAVQVYKRLKVAVFSTGDEVRDPSGDAPDGCIFDANRFSIMGLLRDLGCQVTDIGILPDEEAVIAGALAEAAPDHDMLITSGGISAGEEDHVKAAVEQQGSLNFWRFAIKPGRPIALGQVGTTSFVGLPGNPVAAMVTFMAIARPMINVLSGNRDVHPHLYKVASGFDYSKKQGRREWVRVKLESGKDGALTAVKHHGSGSGILTSMVDGDGLVELGENVETIHIGDPVDFLAYNEVAR